MQYTQNIKMLRSPTDPKYASDPELVKSDTSHVSIRKRKQHSDLEDLTFLRIEIRDMINELKTDRDKQNGKLFEAIEELRSQNKVMMNTNSNIEKILEHTTSLYDNLNKKVEKLSLEHGEALVRIDKLEEQIEQMHRAQRAATLEIRNIPDVGRENLTNMVEKMHSTLQVPLCPDNIRQVRQVTSARGKIVVVEYQSTQQSKSILKALKEYNAEHKTDKFNTNCLSLTGGKQPVYISESLTVQARKLHYFARDLRKNHNFKHCWTSQGKVYVKQTDDSPIIWIKSLQQVEDLRATPASIQ